MSTFNEVKSWHVEPGKGLVINGEVFPYTVFAEGPMVEKIDDFDDLHILWLPLLAEGPCPRAGRPDATPADAAAPETATAGTED